MDRIEAMRAFARVVETGSFTKAAETLQLGRTTVTELVRQLEAHLHVRLLHRTTRKVSVTADGAGYYPRVLRLLADLEDAEASFEHASARPRGRLRIDVPSPFARILLVPALPDFHARYPEIQLDIGVSDREVDLVGDNVDCVIRGGTPPESSLVARPIGALAFGFYAAPAYLQRCGTPTHPRELEGPAQWMVGFLRPGTVKARDFTARRGEESLLIQGRHVIAIDDGDAYLAAGIAGLGVVCLPDYIARLPLARGELRPLLQDWQLPPMPMQLMFPSSRHVSHRLRVFIDWVVELMAAQVPAPAARG